MRCIRVLKIQRQKVMIKMTHLAKMIEMKLNGDSYIQSDFEKLVQELHDKTYDEAQLAAWLMAVKILGLSKLETSMLTKAMTTQTQGKDALTSVIDKHSTGGVGDSVTLLVLPIVAACGVPLIKLSGKSLGFTGGTIDKLSSIPGIDLTKTPDQIKEQVNRVGAYIGMQTDDLCFADKIMYELRDRTGSVASIPLICSSILSKKFSTGAQRLVINLKYGAGAFIKDSEEAEILKEYMEYACSDNNIPVKIVVEAADEPIANIIGTGLEIQNIYRILSLDEEAHQSDKHLIDVSLNIASEMLCLCKEIDFSEAIEECKNALKTGRAKVYFEKMIEAQNGQLNQLLSEKPKYEIVVLAADDGVIQAMDTIQIGHLVNDFAKFKLNNQETKLDYMYGFQIIRHINDVVSKGDCLAKIYYNDYQCDFINDIVDKLSQCYKIKKLT